MKVKINVAMYLNATVEVEVDEVLGGVRCAFIGNPSAAQNSLVLANEEIPEDVQNELTLYASHLILKERGITIASMIKQRASIAGEEQLPPPGGASA